MEYAYNPLLPNVLYCRPRHPFRRLILVCFVPWEVRET